MQISEKQLFEFIKAREDEVFKDPVTHTYGTTHYLKRFKKHSSNFFISWNWAAFFFTGIWFIFRRMYSYAFIYPIVACGFFSVIALFTYLIFSIFSLKTTDVFLFVVGLSTLAYTFIPALFGDSIYLFWAKKQIQREKIQAKGVTWLGGIIAYLFYSIYPLIIALIYLFSIGHIIGLMGIETT